MNNKNHKYSMSDIIATMAINGATRDELERAIKYSAAVIDAERARKDLGIDEIEKKYMTVDSHKSRCRDCACLVEGNDGSWCCDELEKDIHNIQDEDCPETSDSPIEYELKTYEEELEAVDAFFDKYDELISTAQRNSLLGMMNDLDNAMVCIEGHIMGETESNTNNTDLKEAEAYITHVTLILAQMWSDENPDIELTCVNPATGEEMVYTGRPLEPGMQFVSDRMNEISKEIVNEHKEEKDNG